MFQFYRREKKIVFIYVISAKLKLTYKIKKIKIKFKTKFNPKQKLIRNVAEYCWFLFFFPKIKNPRRSLLRSIVLPLRPGRVHSPLVCVCFFFFLFLIFENV